MFCQKCGTPIKEGAKFCHVCGANTTQPIQTPPQTPPPPPPTIPQQPQQPQQAYQQQQQQQQQPQQAYQQQQQSQYQQQQNPYQNYNQGNYQVATSNIFTRAINIMFSPKKEWRAIELETPNTTSILLGYVLPLALIPAIFIVLGYGLIGIKVPYWGSYKSWQLGLSGGIVSFISTIVSVYLTSFIVDLLAPSFKVQKNFGKAMQLVAYSFTPMWVAGIFNIFPSIRILASLLGIYGLVLLYQGFEFTMKPSKDNTIGYFLATLGILIVSYFLLSLVMGLILGAILTPSFGPRF